MRAAVIACCLAGLVGSAAAVEPPGSGTLLVGPPVHDTFKVVRTIDTGGRPTSTLAFSPDSRVLAVAKGKQVHFWDTATGKECRDAWHTEEFLDKTDRDITFLAFIDPKTVAIRADPGLVIHIRAYPSGKELGRLDLGKNAIDPFATANGLIATASHMDSLRLRVWAGPDWKERTEITVPKGYPSS